MGFFNNNNPMVEAIWELTKKQYPEWNAPLTPEDGIAKEEKDEEVNYCENDDDSSYI